MLQDKVPDELRVKVLNVVTRTGTAKRWLAQWLLLMRHNPPNADSVKAQISKISPDVLFAQYALFAEQAREVPLLQKGFAGLFSVVRRNLDLVMRTSKQGSSECWYCGLLKQFLKDGAGFAEKKWIKDLHLEHTSWHNGETKVYEDVCFLAKDPGSGVISMNTDGAASHAHTLPKVEGRPPKNIPEWPRSCRVFWFVAGLFLYSISFMALSLAPT